jgi:hypothetical protein
MHKTERGGIVVWLMSNFVDSLVVFAYYKVGKSDPMSRENWRLVTDEPVGFEK